MQTNFKLDTSKFASAANATERLANTLETAIDKTDSAINKLYFRWSGKSRNEFEKKYNIFEHQIEDIRRGIWDLREDIISAETDYIQADTDMAKKMEGASEGGTSYSYDGK